MSKRMTFSELFSDHQERRVPVYDYAAHQTRIMTSEEWLMERTRQMIDELEKRLGSAPQTPVPYSVDDPR